MNYIINYFTRKLIFTIKIYEDNRISSHEQLQKEKLDAINVGLLKSRIQTSGPGVLCILHTTTHALIFRGLCATFVQPAQILSPIMAIKNGQGHIMENFHFRGRGGGIF